MTTFGSRRILWIPFAFALLSAPAQAQVFQTDAAQTPLPQPVTAAEIQLSDDLGWAADQQLWKDFEGNTIPSEPPTYYSAFFPTFVTGDAVRLSGLFKWRGENIDETADARTAPGYFSPSCGFSGELVLHGGGCALGLGWYNVSDPNSQTPPAASEIYPLIPGNIEEYLQCVNQSGDPQNLGSGFCPLGWDNHHPYNLPQLAWVPRSFSSGDIASDPNYRGGLVAFALVGDPTTKCIQTKHSIAAHNDRNSSGEPWITTLIWQSTVDPEGFYVAFEDLPMPPEDWRKSNGLEGGNDGDFNDFVFFISGISCQGGGQPCDTGLVGACSLGRTDCVTEGSAPKCRGIIAPGGELCDNVDNDCNGAVDDGDGLCAAGQFCFEGNCVPSCANGEFACEGGRRCEGDICVFADCLGVECPAGQACRGGVCKDPCTDVVCPERQECQLGRCVDPCAAITCPEGRVCERGLCVSNCGCRPCADGLQCGADGRCTDPACAGVYCEPGLVCKLGQCVDPCAGVICPGGAACINGICGDPTNPGDPGSGSGGSTVIINDPNDPNSPNVPSGTGGNPAGGGAKGSGASGCSCRTIATDPGAGWLAALLGLALSGAWTWRRGVRSKRK